jgi:hypothetical protein
MRFSLASGANPLKRLLLVGLLFVSAEAFAVVDCTGHVSTLSMNFDPQGVVTLSLTGGPSVTYICAMGEAANGISKEMCKHIYATLLVHKLTNKRITIRFINHSTCAAVPAWNWAGEMGWTMLLQD